MAYPTIVSGAGAGEDDLVSSTRFDPFRRFVAAEIGLHIETDKRIHVSARLRGLARSCGFGTVDGYVADLLARPTREKVDALANRITTNHTFFFREADHFTFVRDVALPEAMERARRRGDRDLRIWSAASSTGQEPYSLVMTMLDALGPSYSSWSAGVLATDISADALEAARRGRYDLSVMDRIPDGIRRRYFKDVGGEVEVVASVRDEVVFRRFNLTSSPWPFKRAFDVILCRNVLIYFDEKTTGEIVGRMAQCLAPGGYLIVGQSESINRQRGALEYVQPSIFRRPA